MLNYYKRIFQRWQWPKVDRCWSMKVKVKGQRVVVVESGSSLSWLTRDVRGCMLGLAYDNRERLQSKFLTQIRKRLTIKHP